jgi:hypothetical protein
MKEVKKLKSWIGRKLENPKFMETFEEEREKLSIGGKRAKRTVDFSLFSGRNWGGSG